MNAELLQITEVYPSFKQFQEIVKGYTGEERGKILMKCIALHLQKEGLDRSSTLVDVESK